MTVPDQSLTIPEILKRYASGRPINVKQYDEYTGDDDNQTGVDIRTMDISEVHDLFNVTKANLQKLQTEKNQRLADERAADLEKSIIAKYEARRAAHKDQPEVESAKFIQLDLPIDPK